MGMQDPVGAAAQTDGSRASGVTRASLDSRRPLSARSVLTPIVLILVSLISGRRK